MLILIIHKIRYKHTHTSGYVEALHTVIFSTGYLHIAVHMANNLCQAYLWVYIIPVQVGMDRRGKKLKKEMYWHLPAFFCLLLQRPFSWNYFLPQWDRACKACWDPLSIFRRPQLESEKEGGNPKIPKCIFSIHLIRSRGPPSAEILNHHISSALADNEDNCFIHFVKLKWKEGKAKWCHHKSSGWDSKKRTR